jgi:hypothetical protein
MQNFRKMIIVLGLIVLVLSSWFQFLDAPASKVVNEGFKRALVSFGTARALNAAISAVQGTEVAVQPMGVGITFTPGQLLDPVNDLVENFSNLMMAACIAFGIQKFLISIGSNWLISCFLTVSAIGWGWFYLRQQQPFRWLSGLLVILLMIRFAIPVITIGTDFLFKKYLNAEYTANQQAISQASSQVKAFKPSVPEKVVDKGWWAKTTDGAKAIVSEGKEVFNFEAHVQKLKQTTESWTEHIISLIVIFLLQTLVVPILLIWGLYVTVRSAFLRDKE